MTVNILFTVLALLAPYFANAKGGDEIAVSKAADRLQVRSAKLWMRATGREERCSGSIVAANVVLTAAHCLVDWKPSEITVILSEDSSNIWGDGKAVAVKKVLFPKETNLETIRALEAGVPQSKFDLFDFALVVLAENIPQPFEAVSLSQEANPADQKNLIMTGFGTSLNGRDGFFHKYTAQAFPPDGEGTEVYLRTVMCSGDSGGGVFDVSPDSITLAAVNSRGGFCGPGEATWLPAGATSWVREKLESISASGAVE